METKQLSPRLAGEWFGIPNTTVYLCSKIYAKFGAGRLVGGVLGEEVQKIIDDVVSCFLMISRLWGFNMDTWAQF